MGSKDENVVVSTVTLKKDSKETLILKLQVEKGEAGVSFLKEI